MYSLNVAPFQRPIFCICVSEYPDKANAFAPPLQRECVLTRSIGIPRVEGYINMVAASFNDLLMSSPHTSYRLPLWKNADSRVFPSVSWFRRCSVRQASALTGQLKGSPFASWCTQTPFHPFFWLSSFSVALSAVSTRASKALLGRQTSVPILFFLKNLTSSNLNCTVCFDYFALFCFPFTVYSPMHSR
jgi:hypothetical protein